MKSHNYLTILIFLLTISCYSQQDSTSVATNTLQLKAVEYNPLSPSKAAFYSAILPGAGQIYNNRYWWQLPLIYGGLGFSVYSYIDSNNDFNRYRTAFKRRKAGLSDEFTINGVEVISDAGLQSAQKQLSKNRDLSMLSAVLVYVLQIVEASVRAHLLQFDTSDNLSISPMAIPDQNFANAPKIGLHLKYSF